MHTGYFPVIAVLLCNVTCAIAIFFSSNYQRKRDPLKLYPLSLQNHPSSSQLGDSVGVQFVRVNDVASPEKDIPTVDNIFTITASTDDTLDQQKRNPIVQSRRVCPLHKAMTRVSWGMDHRHKNVSIYQHIRHNGSLYTQIFNTISCDYNALQNTDGSCMYIQRGYTSQCVQAQSYVNAYVKSPESDRGEWTMIAVNSGCECKVQTHRRPSTSRIYF